MSSDNLKLIGKVALVTGASQGLGFNIAQRFIAEGASVVICARSLADLEHAEADGARDSALLAEPHRWPVLTPIAIDDQKVVRQHVL